MAEDEVTIGIDEVGRGCVWGPVYMAAFARVGHPKLPGVKDSKAFKSPVTRTNISERLKSAGIWLVASMPASAINDHGIEQCLNTMAAMLMRQMAGRLVELGRSEAKMIFDGDQYPNKTMFVGGVKLICESIPKADATCYEVSAASMIAKTDRDIFCFEWGKAHPEYVKYHIGENKGYGTAGHADAIAEYGRLTDHRTQYVNTLLETRSRKMIQGVA